MGRERLDATPTAQARFRARADPRRAHQAALTPTAPAAVAATPVAPADRRAPPTPAAAFIRGFPAPATASYGCGAGTATAPTTEWSRGTTSPGMAVAGRHSRGRRTRVV